MPPKAKDKKDKKNKGARIKISKIRKIKVRYQGNHDRRPRMLYRGANIEIRKIRKMRKMKRRKRRSLHQGGHRPSLNPDLNLRLKMMRMRKKRRMIRRERRRIQRPMVVDHHTMLEMRVSVKI